jgi:hypothetical protein
MKNILLFKLYCCQSINYKVNILLSFFFTVSSTFGTTYYIDSVAGLDSNNGIAITTPWKSLSKINSKALVSGDKIYLKCGSVWNGEQLKFSGSGSLNSPIIVDQYGTGSKPILNGNGLTTSDQGVVYLYNQQYIEINNLEITNYPVLLFYSNNTAYTLNQIVYNGNYAYKVTVAGTTASSPPVHISGSAISGNVTFSYYCRLTNQSYPDNMFFCGISDGTLTNNPLGADRRGVMIVLKDKGTGSAAVANHIYLKNLNIHHIKGQLGNGSTAINGAIPKRTGGIYFTVLNEASTSNSRFNDVLIDGCTISYSENMGLAFDNEDNVYYPGGTELASWTARKFTNIKVSNNVIHHIGKNAMIIRCTDETGLVEHNTCYETALGTTGNTMFTARAKGTIFQYNEGYYNRATTQTVDPGTIDGSMYDPDYGSVGIIFQYSYSHDNSEGIYWGCNTRGLSNNTSGIPDPEDVGCTLRYNISQNDKGDLIFLNYSSAGNEIYNNVFYIKSGLSPNIIHENSGNNHTYNFYNNIIYNLGNGGYAFGSGTGIQTRTIQNNTFYGAHPSDEPTDINKLTSDPLFMSPGAGTIGINSLLEGYKLQSGSTALSSGKLVSANGGLDFFGNVVSSSIVPNRGVYQGEAIVTETPVPSANSQTFCAILNPTVANLVATGTNLKWYSVSTGGSALDSNVALTQGTYYVSQTIDGIESARTVVAVIRNNTAAPTASSQTFCNSGTVADLVASGTDLKWYSAATVGSALASSENLTTGNYYVSQTLNSCESARTVVTVIRNNTEAPTASSQTFCNSGTVANLAASGTDLKWYAAANGGSALASSASLVTGNYYVSQTLNSCESARTVVVVVRNNTEAPTASSQVFCSSGTVANLVATGTDLKWYAAANGGSELASDDALNAGNYYASQTANGCESPRTLVAVTITNGIDVQPVNTNICSVLNSTASISVVATPGTAATYAWYISTVLKPTWTIISALNAGTTLLPMYTNYNTATLNIKKQALLVAGNKYRVVITNGYCGTVTSNEVTLTVNPLSVVKTISGAGAVCSGSSRLLTLATGSVGTTKWQSNVSDSATAPLATDTNWTDIADTTNATTYSASPTAKTWYRVVATSGACSSVASAAVAVTVNQPTAVGSLSAVATTVCKGATTTLTLTSATGTIAWQKATVTNGVTGAFAAVAGNVTTTLTTAALSATTAYRVVVSSGVCTPSISEPITITVSPLSVVKTITGAGAVCSGSSKVLTLATGSVGTTKWQSNVSASTTAPAATDANWTDIAETTNATTYTAAPTAATWYRVVATSGACSSIASVAVAVTVNQPTAVGTLSSNTTVCSGSGTTLTLESATGTIAWQKATVTNGTPGTFAAVAGNLTSSLATGNLTATTAYRVVVSSGVCTASTSNVVIVTVSLAAKATAVSGNTGATTSATAVCSGTKTLTLATGYVGAIQWQSYNAGSSATAVTNTTVTATWTDIDSATSTSQSAISSAAGNVWFRVKLTSAPCAAPAYSTPVNVWIKACQPPVANNNPMPTSKMATPFAVKAYPNPSDSTFQLNFTTSSENLIEIRVYDMIGKLIETRQFSTTEMNNQEVGNSYPSGVYNVIVTQGEEMKTLRVIKR